MSCAGTGTRIRRRVSIRRRARVLVCILAFGAACDIGRAGGSKSSRDANADRVLVTNPATPAWTPETAWRLEETLRIGSADGDASDPTVFGAIAAR